MGTKQLRGGALLSYLSMGLSIIIGLVYTPVMLRILGSSEYGLYNTVASAISMLSLLTLGFNGGYVRYFSKYKKENAKDKIDSLNGMFMLIFLALGAIALVCGVYLAFHLNIIYSDGLTSEEYAIAKVLMLILAANLAISFPITVFSAIISANERFIFLKSVALISQVVSPMVTLPILLMGYRSIGMVTVTVALNVLVGGLEAYYVFFVLRNRFVFHGFEKGLLVELFSFTAFIAINMLVDQINWRIDKILLGRYRGTVAVSVYSVGYYLFQCYMKFSTSVAHVFTPRVHRIVNETMNDRAEQFRQLTNLFTKVGRFQFIILGLLASGVVFFGKEFIRYIWVGEGYDESYYVALLLMIPATIDLIQNVGIEVQRAMNLHKFRSLVYSGMAIINLVLSIYLCQKYGPVGSAVGTAISLILANGLVINIYYYKKCNLGIPYFWKEILKVSLGLLPAIVFGIAEKRVINCHSVSGLLLAIVLYTAVYAASMWFLSMNADEKNIFSRPIRMMRKKVLKK